MAPTLAGSEVAGSMSTGKRKCNFTKKLDVAVNNTTEFEFPMQVLDTTLGDGHCIQHTN